MEWAYGMAIQEAAELWGLSIESVAARPRIQLGVPDVPHWNFG